jgi:hypothetical protein
MDFTTASHVGFDTAINVGNGCTPADGLGEGGNGVPLQEIDQDREGRAPESGQAGNITVRGAPRIHVQYRKQGRPNFDRRARHRRFLPNGAAPGVDKRDRPDHRDRLYCRVAVRIALALQIGQIEFRLHQGVERSGDLGVQGLAGAYHLQSGLL